MREPTVQQLFNLAGRVALVTGGTGHLGAAMCRALAESGASVVIASRDGQRARESAAVLPCLSGAAHHGVALDHMEPVALERGFAEAVSLAGGIDVLVNNGHEPQPADWTTVTGEEFTRQLANATGYFLLAHQMRNHAVARDVRASIVMLGSMYGLVASYPDAYEGLCPASSVAYHTLKGGILQMTRHLAAAWATDGVRVNSLSPGPFPGDSAPPLMVERLKTKLPLKRMGQPFELKGAIVFLASDASSFMTGQNLVIDGGWTAW